VRLFAFIGLMLTGLIVHSQTYSDDWIDYSPDHVYLKFKISSSGLYRIDQSTLSFALQAAGEDLSTIDPRSIQVFARGEEQFIHVEGEQDGTFNTNDYIELYAEPNDGWLDADQYGGEANQTNPAYSLYNDTATYFVTWKADGSFSSARYTTIPFGTPATTPLEYVLVRQRHNYKNTYQNGRDLGGGKSVTVYEAGKGWMSGSIGYNNGSTSNLSAKKFDTPEAFTSSNAPDLEVEVGLAGINRGASSIGNAHHVQIQVRKGTSGSYEAIEDVLYGSYEYVRETATVSAANLESSTYVKLEANETISLLSTVSDYSACAYIELIYPRTLSFDGDNEFEFEVEQSLNNTFFNATGFSSQTTTHLYDFGLKRRYEVSHTASTGDVKTNILPGPERSLFLAAENAITQIGSQALVPVNGDGAFSNPDDLEQDSAFIIVSHAKVWNQAKAYRNYRQGKYNVVLLDIETLYDQFAYGVRKHPAAIRNFIDYALNEWNTEPQYLLIIGKSIEEQTFRKSADYAARNLVPSMGNPVCDNMITAGLAGRKFYVAAVPTGRIAARQSQHVTRYLDKIKEFENSQNRLITPYTLSNRQWQKRILHFAGGNNASENNQFKSYLSGYASEIEDTLFGGQTFLFSKTTGNVIEELNADSVRQLIKEGSALMTFFGHASGNSFDLSVDDASQWNNEGRYPLVVANSCFSGNIHLPVEAIGSVSEDYVLTPNEGAIGFLATPDLSFQSQLNTYTRAFYRQVSELSYGKSLGEQMQKTANSMSSDEYNSGVALEMTLHGDPSIVLYAHEHPELTINDPVHGADIAFNPAVITSDADSFDVIVNISNIGHSTTKPIIVRLERTFPGARENEIIAKSIDMIGYEQTVVFTLETDPDEGIGENSISVTVDLEPNNETEFEEYTNNIITSKTFFISSSDIFPIYPYNMGVVPNEVFTLKASTGYPFMESASYEFQIDTTDLYTSPLATEVITQSGAVLNWQPDMVQNNFPDSTVFFWRVAPSGTTDKWREFSFQILDDKYGWAQQHFFQLKNNAFDLLDYQRPVRKLDFLETSRELFVQVIGNPDPTDYFDNYYKLDGQGGDMGEYSIATTKPAIAIAIIDSNELKPWGTYGIGESAVFENEDHQFNNLNNGTAHRSRVEYYFVFRVDVQDQMDGMMDMLQNHVDDGHYLLFYTQNKGLFNDTSYWSEANLSYMESLGADSIRHAGNDYPYIFSVRKGSPSTAVQSVGTDANEVIQLRTTLTSNLKFGELSSPEIGPAMEWGSFHFNRQFLETNSSDSTIGWVDGITPDNNKHTQATRTDNGVTDLTFVGVDSLPYLELNYRTEDNVNLSPSQLHSWHILYDPAPEAAINPIRGFTHKGNAYTGGLDLHFGVAFENVSEFDFGSFRVHYWYTDLKGQMIDEQWLTYDQMLAGELIYDSVSFETSELSGDYVMYVEINPKDTNWHKEQYHFNNQAYVKFTVDADNKNPLLDVTFDGVHILNGDIVSPSPVIVMELKDENPYLLMTDTTTFDVFLTDPDGLEHRIPFIRSGEVTMVFDPATSEENKASVTYSPEDLADGVYTLKVIGRDASGNKSASDAYRIEFEVITKSSVTHVLNYPNPFTTHTQFVFTLTGSKIPDVFTIQILSVSGKVVREITKDELGPIHIGRNRTEYAWNGRDEFGDQLANGVYLYRVIMKIDGENIERRSTDADQYFTKEFGKMYLFRP